MSTTTVNISFPKELLKSLDHVARQELRNRSELLREAARLYVERKRRWAQLVSFWRREARLSELRPQDVEKIIANVRGHRKAA